MYTPKETESVLEANIEEPAVKFPQNSADESHHVFKCNQCKYSNSTEKGLGMHVRQKHKISQVDGVDDSYVLEENTKSDQIDAIDKDFFNSCSNRALFCQTADTVILIKFMEICIV